MEFFDCLKDDGCFGVSHLLSGWAGYANTQCVLGILKTDLKKHS